MTRQPHAVDSDGNVIDWEDCVQDFAKKARDLCDALAKRVVQLEADKRSLEARLTAVEKKLGKIQMRWSD